MVVVFEQPCWRSDQAKRVLLYTDVLACVTSLVAALATYTRLVVPGQPDEQLLGAFLLEHRGLLLMQLLMAVNAVFVVSTLVLMARQRDTYYKHRLQLCLINRLLRVVLMIQGSVTPSTRGLMALSVAMRSLFLQPASKALAVEIFHPMAFTVQSSLFVLPVKLVFVLQLLVTCVSLGTWSKALPCILQHAAAEASAPAHLVTAAERVCSQAQSWAALLQAAVATPDGGSLLGLGSSVCVGVTAVQTLHIFCSLCSILVLPVAAVFAFETWLQSDHRNSSTSSQDVNASPMPHDTLAAEHAGPSRSPPSSRVTLSARLTALATLAQPLHAFYYLLLTPVVLAATWAVAELLAGVLAASVDCAAVLHASGIGSH